MEHEGTQNGLALGLIAGAFAVVCVYGIMYRDVVHIEKVLLVDAGLAHYDNKGQLIITIYREAKK